MPHRPAPPVRVVWPGRRFRPGYALAALLLHALTSCSAPEHEASNHETPVVVVPVTRQEPEQAPPAGPTLSLSGAAPARPMIAPPPRGLPLDPLFEALYALESGAARGPVTIVQIGDSHTANDAFSGRMRELFQERFGAAGRGMMPPGIPFKYYKPAQVAVTASPGWTQHNSLDAKATGLFGVSGFRSTAARPGEVMSVEARDPEGFDWVSVEVVMRPNGGTLEIQVDGQPVHRLATVADRVQAGWLHLPLAAPARRLDVVTAGNAAEGTNPGGGTVELLSWSTGRNRPGIVYENLGVIGATVSLVGRWDPALVAWELAQRHPALILVAYGTNEGFHDDVARERYAADFARQLKLLRAAAPQAAIVVIGPPDANRFVRGCTKPAPARQSCTPLNAGETENYETLFRERPQGGACRWHPPPNLAVVREAQRAVAAVAGYHFWDWAAAMGGPCSMHAWVTRDPPLALEDHVHLRSAGYAHSAEALFREIMAMYEDYRAQWAPRSPPG